MRIVASMPNPKKLRLTVVEQSPVRKGGTGADALHETIELARAVEAMGYLRFWVAELRLDPAE